MKKINFLFLLFILIDAGSHKASAAIMIDDFTAPGSFTLSSYDGLSQSRTDSGLASVLGGTRKIDVQFGPFGVNIQDAVHLHPALTDSSGTGVLEMDSNVLDFNYFTLTYDANGAGLGADFTTGDKVSILFAPDHFGVLKNNVLSVTLKDEALNTSTQTKTWTPPSVEYNGVVYFQEDFLLSAFAGIDFSHIRSLQVYFEGDYGNDVRFNLIELHEKPASTAIPEPASLLLVAAGLFASRKRWLKREQI